MKRRILRTLAALLVAGLGATMVSGSAFAVPIAELAGPNTLVVGDKQFSNFTCSIDSTVHFGGTVPDYCSSIDVVALTVDPLGISFRSPLIAFGVATLGVTLGYEVQVVDPMFAVDAIGLAFNGALFGLAVTQVTETVFTDEGDKIGEAQVAASQDSLWPLFERQTFDVHDFVRLDRAVRSFQVQKRVRAEARFGAAVVVNIDQSFRQVAVPEPTTIALLGLGLFGLAFGARPRRGRSVGQSILLRLRTAAPPCPRQYGLL